MKANIDALIFAQTGVAKPQLGADGGDDPRVEENQFLLKKAYLRFLFERVGFLPRATPDAIVMAGLGLAAATGTGAAKLALREHLEAEMPLKDQDFDVAAMMLYAKGKPEARAADMDAMEGLLRSYLAAAH